MKNHFTYPIVCGNNIVVVYTPENLIDNTNGVLVLDSNTGKVLYEMDNTSDSISNIFCLSEDTIFLTISRREDDGSETMQSYMWKFKEDTLVEVGEVTNSLSVLYIRVIPLSTGYFALFSGDIISFYDMSDSKLPYAFLDMQKEINDYIPSDIVIMYLSNGLLFFAAPMYSFWVDPLEGQITYDNQILKYINPVTTYPLSDDKAVVDTRNRQGGLIIQIWDMKNLDVLQTLPDLSTYKIKYPLYYAVGLLPNGNLVSVYEKHYLVITNLSSNQHEQVIDLKEDVSDNKITILEDGGIVVKFMYTFKVWR
jgi:hypothetical protein